MIDRNAKFGCNNGALEYETATKFFKFLCTATEAFKTLGFDDAQRRAMNEEFFEEEFRGACRRGFGKTADELAESGIEEAKLEALQYLFTACDEILNLKVAARGAED